MQSRKDESKPGTMTGEHDEEIAALQACGKILCGIPKEAATRIVNYLQDWNEARKETR